MGLNGSCFKKPHLRKVSWSFAIKPDPSSLVPTSGDGPLKAGPGGSASLSVSPSTLNSSGEWRYLRGRKMPMRKCGDPKKTNRGSQPWETRRPYRQAGSRPGGTDALGSGAGQLAAALSRALGEEGHPGGTWGLPLVSAPRGGWRPGLRPGLSPSRRTRPSRGPGCQAGKDGQAYMLRWERPSERPRTPDWPGPRLHLLVGGPRVQGPRGRRWKGR